MNIKRFVLPSIITIVMLALVSVYSLKKVGQRHQEAAISFWGDKYQPSEVGNKIDWGFFGNILMPKGGPMIATDIAGCTDTPLPMVPIDISATGDGRVLCGIASSTMITNFSLDDIQDTKIREALVRYCQETCSPK